MALLDAKGALVELKGKMSPFSIELVLFHCLNSRGALIELRGTLSKRRGVVMSE